MESPHGPQTHALEGICAIKVSMRCYSEQRLFIKDRSLRTDHLVLLISGNVRHRLPKAIVGYFKSGGCRFLQFLL
jgi:hypothetical protein